MTQSKAPPRVDDEPVDPGFPRRYGDERYGDERDAPFMQLDMDDSEREYLDKGGSDLQTLMVASRYAVEHNRVAELTEAILHQFSLSARPNWKIITRWADELHERAQWLAWQEEDAESDAGGIAVLTKD